MKTRKNDKLGNLPKPDQEQLLDWLQSKTYGEVKKLAAKPRPEGLDLHTSISALGRFLLKNTADLPLDVTLGDNLDPDPNQPAGISPAMLSATVNLLQQKALHEALSPHTNFTEQRSVANFVLRLAAVQHRRDQLQLSRDKFEYDAAILTINCLPELIRLASQPNVRDEDRIEQTKQAIFHSKNGVASVVPPQSSIRRQPDLTSTVAHPDHDTSDTDQATTPSQKHPTDPSAPPNSVNSVNSVSSPSRLQTELNS